MIAGVFCPLPSHFFGLTFPKNMVESVFFAGGSYRGNTVGSGPIDRGSNPRPPAILKGPIV